MEIAEELDLGLDSFVFLDDDKANRALIRELIPEVTVIDLPEDVSLYPTVIKNLPYFNLFHLTEEDVKRGKMYIDHKKRTSLKLDTADLNTFVKQLQLKVIIKSADHSNLDRITQLTQKTNQFNLTTRRYTESDIKKMISDPEQYRIAAFSLADRYGDYGITGVAIVAVTGSNEKKAVIAT